MTPKQRDSYYVRKYGITLARYNEMLAEHDNSCHICGWKPKAGQRALAVDHDRKVANAKIVCTKIRHGLWNAQALSISHGALTRGDAINLVRQELKELSVRGLLCWRDNNLLNSRRNTIDYGILNNAALYLRAFQNKLIGGGKT
jgi:hypothetical protein